MGKSIADELTKNGWEVKFCQVMSNPLNGKHCLDYKIRLGAARPAVGESYLRADDESILVDLAAELVRRLEVKESESVRGNLDKSCGRP